MRTRTVLLPCLAAAAALATASAGAPIPLNDHLRMGQRFSAARPVVSVGVCVPSWSDDEGGLTLTLWDSPERHQALALQTFTDIPDNAYVELHPTRPLPPGTYYWEVSERTGSTRIGLYCDELPDATPDCAWLDGRPDSRRRFLFKIRTGPPPPEGIPTLVEALRGGSPEQQADACRKLAAYGDPSAVPALAPLLADPALSHMARYAMESMPGDVVDAAFRTALGDLSGLRLVGVVNSVGVRRDPGAVERLADLVGDPDGEVAAAAAAALGEIGNPPAAAALTHALEAPLPRAGVFAGALRCAARLLEDGRAADAAGLYDRLRSAAAPQAVQLAAARGAVVARGEDGVPLLLELLRAADPTMRGIALWTARHELPGESPSLAMAAALADLPDDLKAPWIGTLAGRGDPATLPVLEAAATAGAGPVRLAAVQALPRFGAAAMPGLLRLLEDDDADVARACRDALAALPRPEARAAAADLLQSPDASTRVVAVAMIRQLQLAAFAEDLAATLRDPERTVRLEAARALRALAATPQIPALRTALLDAADAGEAQALEHALTATAARAGDPDAVAGQLIGPDLHAAPPARHAAILRILGQIGGARALESVLAGSGESAGVVRAAAVDVLCAWPDPAAAPELLRLAQNPATPTEQLACLRGAIRLASNESLPVQQRLTLLDQAQVLIQRDQEKHLLLSTLGSIGAPEALDRASPFLDSPSTREEACAAILAIAESLATTPHAADATRALQHVAEITSNPDFAARARNLLRQADAQPAR